MSNEKTISNIKKAIKEHLDNNYKYDMLVDFELDVIDWNSLLDYINELQQENKQLKEKLDKYENPEDMTLFAMWCTEKVKDENKQLKDNWNKLKEYIKTEIPEDVFIDTEWFVSILDKMQELEQGSDSNE